MENFKFLLCLSYIACSVGVQAYRWKTPDGQEDLQFTACAGDSVTLPHGLLLDTRENLIAVHWIFQAPGASNRIIASFSEKEFNSVDTQTTRMLFEPHAGITLSDVTGQWTGSYYVMITLRTANRTVISVERTMTLNVIDATAPVMKDEQLRVTLERDVIQDNVTGDWIVHLLCGLFLSRGEPPVQAAWTTPTGETVKASYDETKSSFTLPLSRVSAVQSGVHTCNLVWSAEASKCLAKQPPTLPTQAQLKVDDQDVRLLLVEAQQRSGVQNVPNRYVQTVGEEKALRHYDASYFRRLGESQRLDNRVDEVFSLHARLDRRQDDAESKLQLADKNQQQEDVRLKQLEVQVTNLTSLYHLLGENADSKLQLPDKYRHQEDLRVQQLEAQMKNLTSLYGILGNPREFQKSVYGTMTNCKDWKKVNPLSGVRTIVVLNEPIQVYCDQDTDSGGWTVFQRRVDASVDFYRDWQAYRDGFGQLEGNFWLGLDHLYSILSRRNYELRVDMRSWNGTHGYAVYSGFYIEGLADNFRLKYGYFKGGNAGDSLYEHRDRQFSTQDADHDGSPVNCALGYKGAWWYNRCYRSNLNGIFKPNMDAIDDNGISWQTFGGFYNVTMRFTEMKVRPM